MSRYLGRIEFDEKGNADLIAYAPYEAGAAGEEVVAWYDASYNRGRWRHGGLVSHDYVVHRTGRSDDYVAAWEEAAQERYEQIKEQRRERLRGEVAQHRRLTVELGETVMVDGFDYRYWGPVTAMTEGYCVIRVRRIEKQNRRTRSDPYYSEGDEYAARWGHIFVGINPPPEPASSRRRVRVLATPGGEVVGPSAMTEREEMLVVRDALADALIALGGQGEAQAGAPEIIKRIEEAMDLLASPAKSAPG